MNAVHPIAISTEPPQPGNSATQTSADAQDAGLLDRIFRHGRSFSEWQPKAVDKELLKQAFELASLGPTSMNCQPARFVLLETEPARGSLLPCLAPTNVEKTRSAPFTVIVATAPDFYEQLPRLFGHRPQARELYANNAALATETAHRNGVLTAAYLMLALRALGLDCGPMSGFDARKVDEVFFPEGDWKSEFILNIGYGRRESLMPRLPRLAWHDAWREL